MSIIKFPGPEQVTSAQTSPEPVAKLVVGPMSFTCTNCDDTCTADFKNMIFRVVDFHCAGCGTFFRITNPAFTIKTPPKK